MLPAISLCILALTACTPTEKDNLPSTPIPKAADCNTQGCLQSQLVPLSCKAGKRRMTLSITNNGTKFARYRLDYEPEVIPEETDPGQVNIGSGERHDRHF